MKIFLLFALLLSQYGLFAKKPSKINLQVTTWNVNKKEPPSDLRRLLGPAGENTADLVAVGLQEVASPRGVEESKALIERWTAALDKAAADRGLTKVRTVSLVGLLLGVYASQKRGISSVLERKVRAGIEDPEGNKGGLAVGLNLAGQRLGFVAAHLTHSERLLERRIIDFHTIEEQRKTAENSKEDYVFWLGDLNFRLRDEENLTSEKISDLLSRNDIQSLLRMDELQHLKEQGKVFAGYQEQAITFRPTYKFKKGTPEYDLTRRSAWTDRVLYRAADGKNLTPVRYGSVTAGELNISDHIPVEAVFTIKT